MKKIGGHKHNHDILPADKRVRFVQQQIAESDGGQTLNALDLPPTPHGDGEQLQQFYEQLVEICQHGPSTSGGDAGCSSSGAVASHGHYSQRNNDHNYVHTIEDEDDDEEEIVVLHESASAPNLHSKAATAVADAAERKQFGERDYTNFLKAAAANDLGTVAHFCKQGINIEVQDMFRWTALMCATAAGADQVVDFLLRRGANPDHQDYAGRTATDLALKCRHYSTKKMIENFRHENQEAILLSESFERDCELISRVRCSACNVFYADEPDARAVHECSMLHMINTGLLPQEGYAYGISAKSPGYRLLKRYGWTESKGLGKRAEGRKYPVKTVLKRDTKGFGLYEKCSPSSSSATSSARDKKRITHFGPMDVRAVESVRAKKQKQCPPAKLRARERQREMELRRMLDEEGDGDIGTMFDT